MDELFAAVEAAQRRLEARYTPDPLREAFYARWHVAQHPTPLDALLAADIRPGDSYTPEAYRQRAAEDERKRWRFQRRKDRARVRAQQAARAAAAEPENQQLAAKAATMQARAEATEREWQESVHAERAASLHVTKEQDGLSLPHARHLPEPGRAE